MRVPFDRSRAPGGPTNQKLVKVKPRKKVAPPKAAPKPKGTVPGTKPSPRPPSTRGIRAGRRPPKATPNRSRAPQTPSTGLATVQRPVRAAADLAHLLASARGYAGDAKSTNTRAAYTADWKGFVAFALEVEVPKPLPAPPGLTALYLTHLANTGHAVATIERHLTSISQIHLAAGHPSPRLEPGVQEVRKGIRRRLGTRQKGKDPLFLDTLRSMVRSIPTDSMRGVRDRAVLLLGFAMGSRRSELVGLDVEDLSWVKEGLVVLIRRSKTDQEGQGRQVPIPPARERELDAATAVKVWLEESGIENGPLFRAVRGGPVVKHLEPKAKISTRRLGAREIARIVKKAIVSCRCGDPKNFAGHSLRAGLVTEAARAGKSMRAIKGQTGHRSDRMVERYIREAELFKETAALAGLY